MNNTKNLRVFHKRIIADRERMQIKEICKKWGIPKKAICQIGKGKTNVDDRSMTDEERQEWLKQMRERGM